jgi:hypothetical protein
MAMRHDEARELMHEALDGSDEAREGLDAHLAECAECAAEFAAMQRLQAAVGETVSCEPPQDRLDRATVAALAVSEESRGRSWVAFAMAAAVLLAFGIGLLAGREAFPREVVRVERMPQIVERVVEREVEVPVEVPVVEERVVVREVPVYRDRIVYRDRQVEVTEAREVATEPVMPEIREERIVAKPMPITITQTEEIIPAPIAGEQQPESDNVGAEPTADEERLALQPTEQSVEGSVQ